MKKSIWLKFLIMLGCVIMVALPILFIESKLIEVSAASAAYTALKAMDNLTDMHTYVTTAEAATLDALNEDEIKHTIVQAYGILYTEPVTEPVAEGETEGEGTEETEPLPYDPPEADKLLYIGIVNGLKAYYQQSTEYLSTTNHAPTSDSDDLHYYIGETSEYVGVADEGLTIEKGTVTLHVTSSFFTMRGPITVNGGTLNVVLETTSTSNHIKREIESNLRVDAQDGVSNSGYIPVDAQMDYSVAIDENNKTEFVIQQFSGAFFTVTKGTLNINGTGTNKLLKMSGAGQFDPNMGIFKDGDTSNDNNGHSVIFPKQNSTADDVCSKAPIIYLNDIDGTSPSAALNHVGIFYNNNSGISGIDRDVVSGGAITLSGKSPSITINDLNVDNCRTRHSGGFMHLTSNAGGFASLTDVTVKNCYTDAYNATEGGTIRTLGSTACLLSMTRVTFDSNYSRTSASAFLWSAMPAGELVVTDCTIKNNVSYSSSTVICMGRMSIQGDTEIKDNYTLKGDGGAINFSTWSSATKNTSFKLEHDSNLVLGSGVSITGNHAGGKGGAICLTSSLIKTNTNNPSETISYTQKIDGTPYSMSLIINGATVSGNTSGYRGGAIQIEKSTNCPDYVVKAEVNGGTISNNSASGDGGAFYLVGKEVDFRLSGGTVSGNSAGQSGGALFMTPDGKGDVGNVTITGGSIVDNIAQTSGGGIYISKGNVTISGGEIRRNKALNEANKSTTGKGGGIFVLNGNLTIESGEITDNYAWYEGGGLYSSGTSSVVTLNGGNIEGNTASCATDATVGAGGGIHLYRSSLTVNGATIKNNVAKSQGGGIMVNGASLTVMGESIISGNSANESGAACVTSNTDTSVTPNIPYPGSFRMEGGEITGNTSSGVGGAVSVRYNSSFEIYNGSINENTAASTGGAVYLYGIATFQMEGGQINSNTSGSSGGAVYANGTGSFTVRNGEINYNTAKNFAGAVRIEGGASFIFYSGSINGNKTLNNSGGAVHVISGSFTMYTGTIANNISAASAGAIRMANGNFTMYDGIIENNTCRDSGGFMYMEGGTCTIHNGIIRNNTKTASGNRGGAILIGASDSTPGRFIMKNGEIYGNTSVEEAGAVALAEGSSFEMEGGSIYNNSADKDGGAVYIESGDFNMTGGSIYGNTAGTNGGCVYLNNGSFYMSDGDINGNIATSGSGGAVYIGTGNFEMSGGNLYNNTSQSGNGGAVFVNQGNFTMTSGTLTENTAPNGYGGAVYTGGTVTIGAENCNGDLGIDNHPSCPEISYNSAANGGAFSVDGGSPTIHCGLITNNTATADGGAMYVTNGNVVVNYIVMEYNSAANGGGFCIEALTKNLSVTIKSGYIRYNQASFGGGLKVYASGSYVATITVGLESCAGDEESEHKHPDISSNIAEGEGGGLNLVSDSANGIIFTMWCGKLYDNIANDNIPTGNMIQEGGQVAIHGTYTIDNVTVNNGSYLRPSYGSGSVTINFDYRFPDGFTADVNELKSITLTIGEGNNEDMYINLPAYQNITLGDGTTMILLRWSESADNNNVTYETASKLVVNETNFAANQSVTFYGIWIARGAGIAEVPFVQEGQQFSGWQDGSSIASNIGIHNFFSALFEVSECNPANFSERYITFSRPLNSGTSVIMIDLTAQAGVNNYYYYVLDGEETSVNLSNFTKLGSPNVKWSTSRTDGTGESEEDFLFLFDFSMTEESFSGGFWISLTREYVDVNKAPIAQTVSCAITENSMPAISAPNESDADKSVTVTYQPGIAAHNGSIYYGNEAALVISANGTPLPDEAYILIGETQYPVSTSGVIIIPLGDASVAHEVGMKLVSPALANSETAITLKTELYIGKDGTRPLGGKKIHSAEIDIIPVPLPAASISMDERIFYLSDMPGSVSLNVVTENTESYTVSWSVVKQAFGENGYSATSEAAVSDSVLTFDENITEGNFRIILTVKDSEQTVLLTVPYNFIVLES